jgi:hypothetical protein
MTQKSSIFRSIAPNKKLSNQIMFSFQSEKEFQNKDFNTRKQAEKFSIKLECESTMKTKQKARKIKCRHVCIEL